jgi:hypothetical protein
MRQTTTSFSSARGYIGVVVEIVAYAASPVDRFRECGLASPPNAPQYWRE